MKFTLVTIKYRSSPLLENIKYSNEVHTSYYQVSIKLLFLKIIYITSAAPMADLNAEQPSPSQTPTSTASDGADEAPLEINNIPIVTKSMLSEIILWLKRLFYHTENDCLLSYALTIYERLLT